MSDEVIITVRGEDEARVAPERAVVRLSVALEGPDREKTVDSTLRAAEPVRSALAGHTESGAATEWTSKRLGVRVDRPWNNEGKRLAPVYHASIDFTGTFADFAALSEWVADVSAQDGVNLGPISWELTPETRRTTETEVAARAVGVAVARATAYAQALGLQTVHPVEIADTGMISSSPAPSAPGVRMMVARAGIADAAPEMDLRADDIVVSATVEARFRAS